MIYLSDKCLFLRFFFTLLLFFFTLITASNALAANILIVKPGDESATQENAASFLTEISGYLGERVSFMQGEPVEGYIANRNQQGASLLDLKKPVVAFVTVGFYLEHLQDNGIPVAQMPRYDTTTDRYYLVGASNGPDSLDELKAKTVHTTFSIDWKYLKSVVFPEKYAPDSYFTLKPANNMADEVFFLIAPGLDERNADALLMDLDMLFFFKEDPMTWPELKVIWESDELPPGLVVLVGDHAPEHATELEDVLLKMNKDEQGKSLLRLMKSTGFTKVDTILLNKAKTKY